MKSNQDILDEFGKALVPCVYDDAINHFMSLLKGTTKWGIGKEYTEVFNKLSLDDQKILAEYMQKTIGTSIFAFLSLFEENEQFKLIYEKNGKQVNLVEISEMLKAEATIDDGWISRFSEVAKDDEII